VDPREALLAFFLSDLGGIIFADVSRLRDVEFARSFIRSSAGVQVPDPIEEFAEATGVDPVQSVEQVVIGRSGPSGYLAAAQISIDPGVVKEYFVDQGTPSETYAGWALFQPDPADDWTIALDDRVALVGPEQTVRDALDRTDGPTVLDNAELMAAIRAIDPANQVWALGSFAESLVPEGVAPPMAADLIKALERINYQMRVDPGVTARLAGDFSTLETARRAGDLLRGFVAFGKMGSAEQPDMMALLNGLRVETLENSVEIHFSVSEELLDRVADSGLLSRQTD
jgi:hypothetical protein